VANTVADLVANLNINTGQFTAGTAQAGGALKSLSGIAVKAGIAIGGALAISKIFAFAGAAVEAASEFEASMNKVRAVSGATGEDFELLTNQAKDLGATTKFTATEAAEGMNFLAMAGFEVTEILTAMPGVLDLAAAGNLSLARAADITSNVLSGYGIQVEELSRVNDVLAKTFTSSNTSLSQLGEAMKFVAPVASAAGLQFEEVSAALGLLGDAGIQASLGGTSLRGSIAELLNPSKEAADLLERLGVTALDGAGKMRPLSDIIQELGDSGATAGELLEIFGKRGTGMIKLVQGGADKLRDFTRELENAGGTAQRVAEIQMEGYKGQMTKLSSATEGFRIALGERLLPALTDNAESMTEFTSEMVKALEGSEDAEPAFIAVADSLTEITDATVEAIEGLGSLASVVAQSVAGWIEINSRIDEFTAKVPGLDLVREALDRMSLGPLPAILQSLRDIAALGSVDAVLGGVGGTGKVRMIDLTTATGRLAETLEGAKKSAVDAKREYDKLFSTFQQTGIVSDKLGEAAERLRVAQVRLDKAIKESGISLAGTTRGVEEAREAWKAANKELIAVSEAFLQGTADADKLTDAKQKASMAADDLKDAQKRLGLATAIFGKETRGAKVEIEQLTQRQLDWEEAMRNTSVLMGHAQRATDQLAEAAKNAGILISQIPPKIIAAWGPVPDFILQAACATVDAAGEAMRNLDEIFAEAGIKNPEVLAEIARKSGEALKTIEEEFKGNRTVILEFELNHLRKLKVAHQSTGGDITEEQQRRLDELEEMLGKSTAKQVDKWKDFGRQVSTIISDFGKNIADNIVGLFFGGGDEKRKLAEQREELEQSLQEREQAWIDHQASVAEQLTAIRAKNKGDLEAATQDVFDSLDKRRGKWQKHRDDILAEIGEVEKKHREAAEKEVQAVVDGLEKRRQKYEESRADIIARIDRVTKANRRALAERLENLDDNLRDQTERYDDFVTDTQQRLDALSEDSADSIKDRKRSNDRRVADADKRLKREEEDIKKQIKRLEKEGKTADSREIKNLNTKLKRKRDDHRENIRRLKEDLEDWTADHKRKLERQQRDLEESLERRKRDHDQFLAENQEAREKATSDADRQLEKQTADLQGRLGDQAEEWALFQKNAEDKIAAITLKHTTESEAQTGKLKEELGKADTAWNTYRDSLIGEGGKLEQIRATALAKVQQQEAELEAELLDQRKDWEAYRIDVNKELEQIGQDEAGLTFFGKLKGAFQDMLFGPDGFIRSLVRFSTESILGTFLEPISKAINGLIEGGIKKLMGWLFGDSGILKSLGGLFGIGGGGGIQLGGIPIPGAPTVPGVPTPGGGSGTGGGGGFPGAGAGGATVLGTLIAPGIGTAIGAAVDLGIQVAKLVTSIFGNRRRESTLNAIEENTRFGMIHTLNVLATQLLWLPKLESIRNYLHTVQTDILAQIHDRLIEIASSTSKNNADILGQVHDRLIEVNRSADFLHTDIAPALRDISDRLRTLLRTAAGGTSPTEQTPDEVSSTVELSPLESPVIPPIEIKVLGQDTDRVVVMLSRIKQSIDQVAEKIRNLDVEIGIPDILSDIHDSLQRLTLLSSQRIIVDSQGVAELARIEDSISDVNQHLSIIRITGDTKTGILDQIRLGITRLLGIGENSTERVRDLLNQIQRGTDALIDVSASETDTQPEDSEPVGIVGINETLMGLLAFSREGLAISEQISDRLRKIIANTDLIGTDVVPALRGISNKIRPLEQPVATVRQPLLVQVLMESSVVGEALIADLNDVGVTP